MIKITHANPDDHNKLTEITKKSKAYWGYTQELMNEWSDLLTITEEYIQKNEVINYQPINHCLLFLF